MLWGIAQDASMEVKSTVSTIAQSRQHTFLLPSMSTASNHIQDQDLAHCKSDLDTISIHGSGLYQVTRAGTSYFVSMMLYRAYSLMLNADLGELKYLATSLSKETRTSVRGRQLEAGVSTWARSSKARTALWHSAQIYRIFQQEGLYSTLSHHLVHPVSHGALWKGALVMWAYCRTSYVCEMCAVPLTMPHLPELNNVFELAGNPCDPRSLKDWVDHSGTASIGGVLACACKTTLLVGKFEAFLAGRNPRYTSQTGSSRLLAILMHCS